MASFFDRLFGATSVEDTPTPAPPRPAASMPPSATHSRMIQSVAVPVQLPSQGPYHQGHEVDYYPNRGKAVYADPPGKLIESQTEIIRQLRQASALSYEDFDEFIMPVIRNYAEYVHLLPASEMDHHSDLGGLFRHGLEVAFHASRRCEGKEFGLNEDPSVRKFQFFRWRACALLGGMLHDLGKAVIDVGAVDEGGTNIWNPHVQSLFEWTQERGLDFYFIAWNPNRKHREHDALSATALDKIIPKATKRWLGEYRGRVAYDSMILALAHSSNINNPLIDIIRGADSASVSLDKKNSHRRLAAVGEAGTRGLGSKFLRAIRDKLNNGQWPVNVPGNPIWNTEQGLYAQYPIIAKEIIEYLRAQGEQGIPTEAPSVLQILADCGHIEDATMPDGSTYNVHQISIDTIDRNGGPIQVRGTAIKFVNELAIPDYFVLPIALPVVLYGADGTPLTHGGVIESAIPPQSPGPTEGPQESESAASPVVVAPKAPPEAKTSRSKPKVTRADPVTDDNEPVQEIDFGSETVISDMELEAEITNSAAARPAANIVLRDRSEESDARDALIEEGQALSRAQFPPDTKLKAIAWIDGEEILGAYLKFVIGRVQKGDLAWGKHVFNEEGHLYLAFPEVFEGSGNEPEDIMEHLFREHWIERFPGRNTIPAQLRINSNSFLCIRFSEDHSIALMLLLPAPVKAKPQTHFLGPYINATDTARIRSTKSANTQDGPIFRQAVHRYFQDQVKGTDLEWHEITPLMPVLIKFAEMHTITLPLLTAHLKGELITDNGSRDFKANPSYDPLQDEIRSQEKQL